MKRTRCCGYRVPVFARAAGDDALARQVEADSRGCLKEICVGTVKRSSAEGYLRRPRAVADPHGQGPLLWAATAMIIMDSSHSHSLDKSSGSCNEIVRRRTYNKIDLEGFWVLP